MTGIDAIALAAIRVHCERDMPMLSGVRSGRAQRS